MLRVIIIIAAAYAAALTLGCALVRAALLA
jgi:hypothetical protein